ncbi:hypothetical protein [Methylomonas albis]|uniref:PEP-CTERM sorting domain-containing protein n=1 Tax=Methylomonas albis TaxID=1854563 RepID=A0ABR9CXX9_9GAMM|nr:hypothetical protein [Methylomonas albis]MBD9355590.1 hypothetical protein [Methylomonas albis]
MTQFKKLAIAGAISAAMMGAPSAEASVVYNLNTGLANGDAVGPWSDGTNTSPTGYTGHLPATWLDNIQTNNQTDTVSTAGLLAAAPSTTLKVESLSNRWNPANSWGNALDFGLITLSSVSNLTITVAADASLSSNFKPGFTLFSGWDTSATSNKHGSWNVALPAVPVNPRGTTGLTYLGQASSAVGGGTATYTFTNLAAGNYSLWIGGAGLGTSTTGGQTYVATLSTSPVPVPGAVWLFGSAMAGLIGFGGRRKAAVTA